MTWDGIPEHRNLHRGEGEVPDLSAGAAAARFLRDAAARQQYLDRIRAARAAAAGDPATPPPEQVAGLQRHLDDFNARAEALRSRGIPDDEALRHIVNSDLSCDRPHDGDMADPFTGTTMGAIAQHEMFRSLTEGGFTEPQALYYLACLVQVGLAMRMGRFDGDLPPWPQQPPEEP
jgi:hypothetical protein